MLSMKIGGKMSGAKKDCDCGGHSKTPTPSSKSFSNSKFQVDTSNVVSAKKSTKKRR